MSMKPLCNVCNSCVSIPQKSIPIGIQTMNSRTKTRCAFHEESYIYAKLSYNIIRAFFAKVSMIFPELDAKIVADFETQTSRYF